MKMHVFALLSCLCVVLSVALASGEEIRLAAGGPAIEAILKPIQGPFMQATGITLNIVETGGKLGTQQLERGEADAMIAGFSLEGWKKLVQKEGIAVQDVSAYQAVVLKQDRVMVAVNGANPVTKLSKEQLKGIFTDKITSWTEVGGPDMPIIVVWAKFIPGPNSAFVTKILDETPPSKDVLEVNSFDDLKATVSSTPQAISIYPTLKPAAGIKLIESPEVTRPSGLFTKGVPAPKVKKLIEFIQNEGKQYIKE